MTLPESAWPKSKTTPVCEIYFTSRLTINIQLTFDLQLPCCFQSHRLSLSFGGVTQRVGDKMMASSISNLKFVVNLIVQFLCSFLVHPSPRFRGKER